MKWTYDYEHQKMVYVDSGGYNYSENRLMEAGTFDDEDEEFEEDDPGYEHDHSFNQKLLESDEEQAMISGWFQNENYNNTYGVKDEEDDENDDYHNDLSDNDDIYFDDDHDDSQDLDDYDDFNDFDD